MDWFNLVVWPLFCFGCYYYGCWCGYKHGHRSGWCEGWNAAAKIAQSKA